VDWIDLAVGQGEVAGKINQVHVRISFVLVPERGTCGRQERGIKGFVGET
jgi:hypothetical protein